MLQSHWCLLGHELVSPQALLDHQMHSQKFNLLVIVAEAAAAVTASAAAAVA